MSASLFLLNPNAGGGKAARLAGPAREWIASNSVNTQLHVATGIDDAAARIAALGRNGRVAIAGGDGTFNRLLPALVAGGHCAAVVPAGSGNDVARALGSFGLSFDEAMQLAFNGTPSPMDLGVARWTTIGDDDGSSGDAQREALFASSFTAGFDSAVVRRVDLGPQWLRGLPRYLLATLREVGALRNWRLKVSADGALVHDGDALFCSTLNTPTFGSGMPAVPSAHIDDGQLDMLLAGAFGRAGTLAMLPRLLAGWHLGHSKIRVRRALRLDIEPAAPLPIAADGEYLGEATRLSIEALPAALQVVRA